VEIEEVICPIPEIVIHGILVFVFELRMLVGESQLLDAIVIKEIKFFAYYGGRFCDV